MSNYAKKVKKWYDSGEWSKAWVHNAVAKGKITPEEYEIITGEVYVA